MRSSNEAARRLQLLAEAQAGVFTAKQAQAAGYSVSSHTYHVQQGHWIREHRGIYRLASAPAPLRPELARWHLWAMDRAGRPQGVYSHSTALGLYIFPGARARGPQPKLEMTVPRGFRRSGATPAGLMLRYGDLPESDIAAAPGYRLTTPLRTILDLMGEGRMPRAKVSNALQWMIERRLITRAEVRRAKVPERSRRLLETLLG
jgi:hypothetical protein